jgi:hypothetical protein
MCRRAVTSAAAPHQQGNSLPHFGHFAYPHLPNVTWSQPLHAKVLEYVRLNLIPHSGQTRTLLIGTTA